MADNVTGFIGQEQVELNNAATESTLRLILAGIKGSSKEAAAAIDKMVVKAGIDAKTVEAANTEVKKTTTSFKGIKDAADRLTPSFNTLVDTTEKLVKGNAQASDMLDIAFKNASGVVAMFGKGLIKLAQFQEEALSSYRSLTQSGINFGGSLTDLRMAASNSYMTLDSFATLMKSNSQDLTRLGGSANSGAVAFSKFSREILSSQVGAQLMALGYDAKEANQGMITYLSTAGVSNAKDLASNKELREGTAQYLNELDRLSELTGKSREELNETMKKQKLDAEIQVTGARMGAKERAVFEQNVRYMTEKYGAAGKDMALAQAQGRAVITKEGQTLTALAPGMQAAVEKMNEAGIKYGVGSKQYIDAQNEAALAAQQGLGNIPTVAFSANDALKSLSTATISVANDQKAGLTSKEAFDARDKKIADERAAREVSQAKAASDTQRAMSELGQKILAGLMPIVDALLPILNGAVSVLSFLIDKIFGLNTIVVALTAAFVAYKVQQLARAGMEKLNDIREKGLKEAFKSTALGQLGSKSNPMYVIIVGGGAGGLEDLLDNTGGKKSPKTGNNVPAKRAARLAKFSAGTVGAVAGAAMLASDISDINAKLKAGEITAEEALKQKGGAVGEAGGGLAGGLAGAATGALIGSVVPVIGTTIGGAIGGAIGAFGGGWGGRTIGEKIAGPGEKPKMADGGIATRATAVTVGESGPEAIIPLAKFENLQSELQTLNTTMKEVLKYMRDTADNTKKTHDATRSLNGNMFAV